MNGNTCGDDNDCFCANGEDYICVYIHLSDRHECVRNEFASVGVFSTTTTEPQETQPTHPTHPDHPLG